MPSRLLRIAVASAMLGPATLGAASSAPSPLLAARPYAVQVPSSYDGRTRVPALVVLPAFSVDAYDQDAYLKLGRVALARGLLLVLVSGTRNRDGHRFWNATDACCDFHGQEPDDVAYLDAVLEDPPVLHVGSYPDARASLEPWRVRNGCGPAPDESAPPLDLDDKIPGAETLVQRWPACRDGAVELWTVRGAGHQPALSAQFPERIVEFLARHPRPR